VEVTKPVILTVDDDPAVLGAIERDLRRHYRADYRVLKAASGTAGLQAARELAARNTPIALFLVDQRMPGMTGTELLREVSKLHPSSRRVLLTAYADTDVAITGINEIGLDHYLMKPWDPPEQQLYPVLDDLLGEWRARVRPPFEGIRVLGSEWSPQSYQAKEFLSRNRVPYEWVDIERDPPARALAESLAGDLTRLPVVIFADGSHLVAPSQSDLAAKSGMQTQANRPFYDVIVIGGGPAGLANAVYAASEGLRTVLVESAATGGQAGTSSLIENYLGFPGGVTGADLAHRATAQARRFGAELLTGQEAVSLRREDPYRVVVLADGTELTAYTVVITTGMSARTLNVPGVDSLQGVGVYYGAAMTEAARYRDKDVCVVGGANSAGQGALFFSRYARRVTILVRAPDLLPLMSQYLVDRIRATKNIEVLNGVEVESVHGSTSGQDEIYVRSYPDPSSKVQISVTGGEDPAWSPDGSRVYYRAGSALLDARVSFAATFTLLGRDTVVPGFGSLSGGVTGVFSGSYSPARDGTRFLALVPDKHDYQLVVSPNWITELRRRVAESGGRK
jgi:thioredoxin reductase (NADPH)